MPKEINKETVPGDLGIQFRVWMELHRPTESEGTRRRRRLIFNVNVRRRVPVAGSPRGTRGRQSNSTPPWNDVMKYMVPSWLVIVAMKYQEGAAVTLLTEDPIPTCCFLTSNCAYWLIAGKMKLMRDSNNKCFQWLIRAAVASELLSVLSLLSVLLPRKFRFVPLVIWILLLFLALARPLFSPIRSCIRTRLTSVVDNIRALRIWPRGNRAIEATHLRITSVVDKICALRIWPGGNRAIEATHLPV